MGHIQIQAWSLHRSKLFIIETLVRDQVTEFLESNQLIKDSQHGFRKGSSCLTNLLTFLDKVLQC